MNDRGFTSISIPLNYSLNLSKVNYLCEYKDGNLRKSFELNDQFFNNIYAKNITTTNLNATTIISTNLNISNFFFATGTNVGIGTTSPSATLNVKGTTLLTDASGKYDSWFPYSDNNSYITGKNIYFRGNSTSDAIMLINTTITGPSQLLSLYTGTGGYSMGVLVNGSGINIPGYHISQGTTDWRIETDPSGRLFFSDYQGTAIGRIVILNATGNVGIGTSTPASKLEVIGNTNITGNLTLGLGRIMYNTSSNSYIYYNTTDWIAFGTGSGVPAGAIMAFNSASCPAGWILADGTSGTPDLRGIFIRGSGTSGSMKYANGSYYNIGIGTYGNDSIQNFAEIFTGNALPPHTHTLNTKVWTESTGVQFTASGTWLMQDNINPIDAVSAGTPSGTNAIASAGASTGTPRTGAETSPAYYATIYCVKTSSDSGTSTTIWGTSGNTILLNNQSNNLSLANTSTIYYAPVSSEPSLGTPHQHFQQVVNTVPGNNNIQTVVLTGVPAGATAAEGYMTIIGNAGAELYVYDSTGINVVSVATSPVTGVVSRGWFMATLDSSKQLRYRTTNYLVTTQIDIELVYYYI